MRLQCGACGGIQWTEDGRDVGHRCPIILPVQGVLGGLQCEGTLQMADKPRPPGLLRRLWRDYALGIVWAVAFAITLALHYMTQVWWAGDSNAEFFAEVFANHQSEFLQVGLFIVLSKYLVYRGSPQSRDGDDEQRETLARIERMLRDRDKEESR